MIAIRITAGDGLGQVFTYPGGVLPPRMRARVAGGTAEIIQEDRRAETAMLEPRSSAAVSEAQNPPPRAPARGAGGRFQKRGFFRR